MVKFPTLYKKTSTGAIQFWEIGVIDQRGSATATAIVTIYGQVDGQEQLTQDLVQEGKNIGKKNETTPRQQAEAEAKSKWEKKKKGGYVESIEAAKAGELDDLIEGGIEPMLAHKYSQHGHKFKIPGYTQPKLDGIRCTAIIKNGICTLWSRTRKRIKSMPHIVRELETIFPKMDIKLDGELYNHKLKSNFEKIVSMVRQDEPHADHAIVQYHIYDTISDGTFQDRIGILWEIFESIDENSSLRLVPTEYVKSEDDIMMFFDRFVEQGYEGSMLRNMESKYVNKRSYDLLKVKEFDDAEFKIIGIEEGRGKLSGHVGAFVCVTPDGKEFRAKAKGDTENLRQYFERRELWSGRLLTVQYQGLTGYGIPRFPVGIRIRLDE